MSRPLILMYHRVAEDPADHWGLAVSPDHFAEQLDVLRRTRHPLPLTEFIERLVADRLPPDAVALTFDDGYLDNLTAAMPLLADADMPATVFVASGFVDSPEPFWWDELVRLVLLTEGPPHFEVEMAGEWVRFNCDPEPAAEGSVDRSRARVGCLETIYHPLRRLNPLARQEAMRKLRTIFSNCQNLAEMGRPMTSAEVRSLAATGLVTIGAHTVTHPLLPRLDVAAQYQEIAGSKLACEAIVGAPVTEFAYPFGEFDPDVCQTVATAGFGFACSTGLAPTVSASALFALRRIYIPDLAGDAFEQRINSA